MTAAMDIAPLLGVTTGVTALIGGGGKTTLLYTLTEELRRRGTVILTTSTHIQVPPDYPLLPGDDAASLAAALAAHGAVCAAGRNQEGKLAAPALSFETLVSLADYVLVEADGSKRLPAKAHETWEPVLPPERTRTICVLGATAFGQPIRQAAHRPAIYARLAGAPWSAVITPEMAARVICAEGLCDIIYVNQVDDPEVSPPWAEAFVRASSVPVVAGSLQARRWRRIS